MLEDEPSNHETVDIPTESSVVEPETDHTAVVPEVYKYVADNNAASAAAYAESSIEHTPTPAPWDLDQHPPKLRMSFPLLTPL